MSTQVSASPSGFTASCGECGRVVGPFKRPSLALSAVCHCGDCPACDGPLFGPIRTEIGRLEFATTHCAWCGDRFHQSCLSKSPNGTNEWCLLCLAEHALTTQWPVSMEVML
jgi:hypothetical protein